ncbi:MAG TPA: FtsX-like permease family protein [Gammaproteobacteria bacterium]
MIAQLRKASLRFYLRHPWQLGLAILGVALGVGVYVGVSLANDAAASAFDVAASRIRGQITHRLVPLDGALDEREYRELVLRHGVAAAPVIERDVGIAGRPGLTVPLLGLDLLQAGMTSLGSGAGFALAPLIAEPGTVLLPDALADELRIDRDAPLTLIVAGRDVTLRVIGRTPIGAADVGEEPPLLADIATAQEVLGYHGRLDRIDMRLTEAEASALAGVTFSNALLVPVEAERSSFRELTAAFRTNLTALGLLALVVGSFLIYGTMAFAVVQRTSTLGVLRALGVSRGEMVRCVLFEASAIAVVATLLGLGLGHVLAIGLVDLVLRTIGDLSFGRAVAVMDPSPWIYAQGVALGLGATLLAAVKPALDAARAAPALALRRAALERRARAGARRGVPLAVALLVASGLTLAFGPSDLYVAFGALFGVLAAGALLTPMMTVALMRAIDRAVGRRLGLPVTLAIRGVGASLSRTGVATAALAIAVATVNGVGLMIGSFRTSLDAWLDTTLTADVYVSSAEGMRLGELVESQQLAAIPGVEGLALTRARMLPTPRGDLAIRAVAPGDRGFGLTVVAGDPEVAVTELAAGRAVLASERLLLARGLVVGDQLELPTPSGSVRLPVAGAFRDFNTGEPSVVVALARYRREWQDAELTGIGLDVAAGVDVASVEAAVRSLLPSREARVRSSAGIKRVSLEIFDRTFKVTEVLRILAGIVAFLGILSALLAIELERARELSVLRTIGFTPRSLGATLLTQTGLLGFAAGLAAVPIGTVLALLLVEVINRRSFGWSMDFVVTPGALGSGLLLAIAAALLAGIYPSWRASRIELGSALREE